jgi:hypothetical protein
VKPSTFVSALALSTSLALAGCAGGSSNTSPSNGNPAAQQAGFAQFTDVPIPPKNSIDLDRTLVFGSERDWIGRISLSSSMAVSEIYDFYKREMPKLGWTELTSVRSAVSVLSYQQDARIATIQVSSSRFGLGSQIDFWMNPRAQGGSFAGGGSSFSSSASYGTSTGATRSSVDSAPLPSARR